MQLQATPTLSLAGQYFFDWDRRAFPKPVPSSASTITCSPAANPSSSAPRRRTCSTRWASTACCAATTSSRQARRLAFPRWSPEWLDGTLGGYYRVTADVLPQGNATPAVRPGTPAALCKALGFIPLNATTCYINPTAAPCRKILGGTIGRYGAAYADDIKIYGLSLSKNVMGVSIGADLNYRENMPLLSDIVNILPASLQPFAAILPAGALFAPPEEGETAPRAATPGTACSTASPPSATRRCGIRPT